ncbi:MAG: glycoside hydrolase family 5 protein [Erysipelotrichaceae bacterium]|nr:glycoside hydrolase family 5 protein [Erysipelotrichaceae bacterium]
MRPNTRETRFKQYNIILPAITVVLMIFFVLSEYLFAPAAASVTGNEWLFPLTVMAETGTARPSVNGHLHVEGTQLVDEKSEAVVLKGISSHGLTWYPEFIDEKLFADLSEEWDCNLIRLAAYSSEYRKGHRQQTMDVLFHASKRPFRRICTFWSTGMTWSMKTPMNLLIRPLISFWL